MKLTKNEIVYILKTWNAFYLLNHDANLNSDASENITQITITPCRTEIIREEVIEDLKSYTDYVDIKDNEFSIKFIFTASEHQPSEIFEAMKPVMEICEHSQITIKNSMEFIAGGLPSKEEVFEGFGEKVIDELDKLEDEKKVNKPEINSDIDPWGTPQQLHNELLIEGKISPEGIEINTFQHNHLPFEEIETFLEASRLYETIERNFQAGGSPMQTSPFQCASEEEAAMVSLYLGTATDLRARIVKGAVIETGATPEELASIVTIIRYQKKIQLFSNPYIERVRYKRKKESTQERKMLSKTLQTTCSCLVFGLILAVIAILWVVTGKGK
ncbi:MAG: hypothetical protein ACLFQV_09060 [Vulcanimicrobiota bacterium]